MTGDSVVNLTNFIMLQMTKCNELLHVTKYKILHSTTFIKYYIFQNTKCFKFLDYTKCFMLRMTK